MSKSTYKTIAEAITFGGLGKARLTTSKVDHRRLTIDEIKEYITEEFGEAKKVSDVEAIEKPRGWTDDVLEKEIDWIKSLKIQEFFKKE